METRPLDVQQSVAEQAALNPFRASYEQYGEVGWLGTLPLPYRAKKYPPTDFTGVKHEGVWPTNAKCVEWTKTWWRNNIAIRLPRSVVGIDVDHYMKHGVRKMGADQLGDLIKKFGSLPATWTSTRRETDSPSRIYFFRVPEDVRFESKPRDDIEVIQHGHRYAVVWPSVVPDDDDPRVIWQYAWYGPDGQPSDRVPRLDELAELPPAWVEGLRKNSGQLDMSRLNGHRDAAMDKSAPMESLCSLPPDDPSRSSNEWVAKVAGHLARVHVDFNAYVYELQSLNDESETPHPEDRFMATAKLIWSTEQILRA